MLSLSDIKKNLGSMLGWRTGRKLVLFLVDDYGSIRMASKEAFTMLVRTGIKIADCRYNRFETLESNSDLECLFATLSSHKDKNGNHPVFTPIVCVANPDFARIEAENFQTYYYEPFTETLARYPEHDRVFALWQEGIEKRLFVPQFHGREHLNVKRWLSDLRHGVKTTRLAFKLGVTGISPGQSEDICLDYQAAFDLDSPDDIESLPGVLHSGLELFERLLGYKACFFTPCNQFFNHRLDSALHESGISLINAATFDREPLGNGRYKRRCHYLGQRNRYGQKFIIRTTPFEPSASKGIDWVDKCLADVSIAFRWGKPAIISSHRVNFCGHLDPENRARGLRQLDVLLARLTASWPDVEFLSMRDFESTIRSADDE